MAALVNVLACVALVVCVACRGNVQHMHIDEDGSFYWRNCKASDPIQIEQFSLTPDPVIEGQAAQISLNVNVGMDLVAPIKVKLSILVNVGPDKWVEVCNMIPTLDQCVISDLCQMFKKIPKCPDILTKQGLDCSCPIKKGAYGTQKVEFKFPELPIAGAIKLHIDMRNGNTNSTLGCLDCMMAFIG